MNFSRSSAQLRQYRKNIRANGEWNNLQGMVRCTKWGACQDNKSGKRVCGSSWCLIGVCATSPNSQISHREVWDHHCKPSAWGKKDPGKQYCKKEKSTQNLRTNPSVIASPWRNHFREIHIHECCPTGSGRASLQHLVLPCWNYHVNTLLTGILQTTDVGEKIWNLQKNISRKRNYITKIYDENLSRQRALQDTTLKTFPPSLLLSKDLCLCCRSSKIL